MQVKCIDNKESHRARKDPSGGPERHLGWGWVGKLTFCFAKTTRAHAMQIGAIDDPTTKDMQHAKSAYAWNKLMAKAI